VFVFNENINTAIALKHKAVLRNFFFCSERHVNDGREQRRLNQGNKSF
jgi:hypothetical protein